MRYLFYYVVDKSRLNMQCMPSVLMLRSCPVTPFLIHVAPLVSRSFSLCHPAVHIHIVNATT